MRKTKAQKQRTDDVLDTQRAEIHHARTQVAEAADTLRHLADSLQPAIHEFFADDEPDRLRAAATQIRAHVVALNDLALDLAVFSGRLEGLAAVGRAKQ